MLVGGAEVDVGLGTAVAVLAVIRDELASDGVDGRLLGAHVDRRVDVEAARVGLLLEHVVDEHAGKLGRVLGGDELLAHVGGHDFLLRGDAAGLHRLGLLGLIGEFVDVAEIAHASEHVVLAHGGARRIDDRVVGRRRDGKTRERGGLADRDLVERAAEVGSCGALEAVGALTQIDLVHVDLEDLVLRKRFFDLEGHRDLVELAGVGALGREEEVAGNLLRDGRAALAAAAGQHVGECGADDAGDLDAGVFVEAVVLGGENGVLDVVGHFGEAHEVAALLPELADELAVGAPDAKRHARTIVGKRVDRGELPVDEGEDEDGEQNAGGDACSRNAEEPSQNRTRARGFARRLLSGGGSSFGLGHVDVLS